MCFRFVWLSGLYNIFFVPFTFLKEETIYYIFISLLSIAYNIMKHWHMVGDRITLFGSSNTDWNQIKICFSTCIKNQKFKTSRIIYLIIILLLHKKNNKKENKKIIKIEHKTLLMKHKHQIKNHRPSHRSPIMLCVLIFVLCRFVFQNTLYRGNVERGLSKP